MIEQMLRQILRNQLLILRDLELKEQAEMSPWAVDLQQAQNATLKLLAGEERIFTGRVKRR